MSFQPSLPDLFTSAKGATAVSQPATTKQLAYAQQITKRTNAELPEAVAKDRAKMSAWIDAHKPKAFQGPFANYPSSKQVAFAERIARIKRREIPRECFQNKQMMSKWIDGNKPH